MDAKQAGNVLVMVGETDGALGGAHVWLVLRDDMKLSYEGNQGVPQTDSEVGPRSASAVADLIARGLVKSAHDCSEGGVLVAAAEMAFAGGKGLTINLDEIPCAGDEALNPLMKAFNEATSRYLLEVADDDLREVSKLLGELPFAVIGAVNDSGRLRVSALDLDLGIDELSAAWRGTLDW